ncbi:hypothetical protein [Methylorubrum extorquens]
MSSEDHDIEPSPLSGPVMREGVTVWVYIYRFADTDEGWTLEVVDHEDGSTVWEGSFDTDVEAYEAFEQCIREDGIRTFTEYAPTRH